jgi:hypothetical protein
MIRKGKYAGLVIYLLLQNTRISAADSKHLPSIAESGESRCPDHRIEAGSVPSACIDCNSPNRRFVSRGHTELIAK